MKSTVEQLSPTRVKISVDVPFTELKPSFDKAFKALAQQVKVPGFRPGKAPARIIEQRVGRGAILEQVVNEAIPAKYSEVVTAESIKVIGQPDVEITKLEDGDELSFTAEVDIRPEITLPDFSTVEVTVDPLEVSDSDVDQQLDLLRERFGALKGVERAAADGDFVSIDLAATVDGEEVADAATSGLSHQVGSGQLIDGLDEAIVGLSAGESKNFTTTLQAGEHAGKQADVTVTVGSVKERELPAADDDFAQLASEFDTIEELRGDLRERAAQRKQFEQAGAVRDKVIETLLETVDIPVPDKVVQSTIDAQLHDLVHGLDHDEERFNQLLEAQGTTREKFDADAKESAERAVKLQLLMDAIVESENTQIGQNDLSEAIMYQAQRHRISPEQYLQQMTENNQLGAVVAEVRRTKALTEVVGRVKATDTAGNVIDFEGLFGTPGEADLAEESAE